MALSPERRQSQRFRAHNSGPSHNLRVDYAGFRQIARRLAGSRPDSLHNTCPLRTRTTVVCAFRYTNATPVAFYLSAGFAASGSER